MVNKQISNLNNFQAIKDEEKTKIIIIDLIYFKDDFSL